MSISGWSSDVCSSDLERRLWPPPWKNKTGGALGSPKASAASSSPSPGSRTVLKSGLLIVYASNQEGERKSAPDRKSVVLGKSVSVRVDPRGGRIIKKKKESYNTSDKS